MLARTQIYMLSSSTCMYTLTMLQHVHVHADDMQLKSTLTMFMSLLPLQAFMHQQGVMHTLTMILIAVHVLTVHMHMKSGPLSC